MRAALRSRYWLNCILWTVLLVDTGLQAEVANAGESPVAVESPAIAVAEVAPDLAAQELKRQKVVAAILVLCLICVAGLALVVVAILWGHRVRKEVDAPLPKQQAADPLWYLRGSSPQSPDKHSSGNEKHDG